MTANVLEDLKRAEISLAQVQDVGKLQEEARDVLGNFRTTLKVKEEVESALSSLEGKTDYQITPEEAKQVDDVIRTNGDLSVRHGQAIINGTEAFGIDITPSEWRSTRSVALRGMLTETYKNIKRWANALAENFHRSWVELTTSTEVLSSRLEQLDITIDVVGRIREGCDKIELNELLSRTIAKGGMLPGSDVAKHVQGQVNYITSCLRSWEMEQIRYKNSVIRYFGNERNHDITNIERQLPKLFAFPVSKFDSNEGMLISKQSMPLPDNFAFQAVALDPKWVKAHIKSEADNTLYADSLSLTGYHLLKIDGPKAGKLSMAILPLNQIMAIRDVISGIIDSLNKMNVESDPVNFNPDDVKDVLATLRNGNTGEPRAYQYGLITADYQYDVNAFKTQVSGMLIVLASHLITMLNLHLECYDVE